MRVSCFDTHVWCCRYNWGSCHSGTRPSRRRPWGAHKSSCIPGKQHVCKDISNLRCKVRVFTGLVIHRWRAVMFLVGLIFNLFFFSFVHLLGQFFVNLKSYVHQKRNLGEYFRGQYAESMLLWGQSPHKFPPKSPISVIFRTGLTSLKDKNSTSYWKIVCRSCQNFYRGRMANDCH